ncbi:DUF6624 domain-containing protein [Streptomyces sp. NPDC101062]|uniref:DUF6624 domain-containing protein n=1 Tax=unclassified Streptomyces TaxID=2593676 RepID=UPI0038169924
MSLGRGGVGTLDDRQANFVSATALGKATLHADGQDTTVAIEETRLTMNHDLASELHRRAAEDQAARHLVAKTRDARNEREMIRIDTGNTTWLKQAIAEHGWPGIALVGEQGANEAWLLTQHADLDPAFQRQALELLKAAVTAGDALPRHLAYLTDRVLVAAGEPQVYGTQYTDDADGSNLRRQPVTDPDQLDERRAAVGLEPSAEYDRRMRGLKD